MDWNDVGTALAGIAPGLANMVLPGAGIPIAALERALGADQGAFLGNPAAAAAAVQAATPEQKIALRQAENQLAMAQMANSLATMQAYLADGQNARQRDLALRQAGQKNKRADVMVTGFAVGLIACLGTIILFKGALPGEAVGLIAAIAGTFGSCLKDASSFEFGTSRRSEQTDTLLARMVLPTPALPPLPAGAKVIDTLPWLQPAK